MATRVNWYGPQVKSALDQKVARRLTLAAYVVEGEIKRSMYNELLGLGCWLEAYRIELRSKLGVLSGIVT